jgi:hypothetical protein
MLAKKEVILAKIESTYGSDPTPTALADSVWARPIELTTENRELVRNLLSNSLSKPCSVIAPSPISFNLPVELKSHGHAQDGLVATPIEIDPLLRACGLGVTYNIGTDITYSPVSSSFESVTIWIYLDGMIHKVNGCRGNLEIVLEGGEIPVANFQMTGLWSIPVDGSIVSPTLDTNKPTKVAGATFTIGGYAAINKGMQIDLGNVLSNRMSVIETYDVKEIEIVDRDPRGSFEPEAIIEATNSYWADMIANTENALSMQWGAAGDIILITAPKVQYTSLGWGERDGRRIYTAPLKLSQSSGDDEFVLLFK